MKRKRQAHPARLRARRSVRRAVRQKYAHAKHRQLWRFTCLKKQAQLICQQNKSTKNPSESPSLG